MVNALFAGENEILQKGVLTIIPFYVMIMVK